MKERIEELARELCFDKNTSDEDAHWYLTTKQHATNAITTAVNEALELAAKEWVGLTDEEIEKLLDEMSTGCCARDVRVVQEKLKEKNT